MIEEPSINPPKVLLDDLGILHCGQSPTVADVNTDGDGVLYVTGPEQWQDGQVLRTKWTTAPKRIAPENSIFIAVKGAGVGKMAFGVECAIGRDVYAFEPSRALNSKFIFWAIKEGVNEIVLKAQGDIPGLSKAHILEHAIKLPPLSEQSRIVDKIETMFDEIDAGIQSLQTARATLNIYRQSLLKSAYQGDLTTDWRAQCSGQLESPETLLARIQAERDARHKAALDSWRDALAQWRADGEVGKKPSKPKRIEDIKPQHIPDDMCPNFPKDWGAKRFGDLNLTVSDGPFGSNLKTNDYTDSGVRVIRLENIGYGEFLEEKQSFISEEKYETIKKHSVYPGTIVVSSFVTDAVRSCIVPQSIPLAINKADCFAAVLEGEQTVTKFAAFYLRSPQVFDQVGDLVHGVGRPRINTTQLKELHFPICPPAEQAEIVRLLDAQLEAADALEAEIDAALTRVDALRQSVLKKAFSGQLVPQDPEDEPAAVLLERIRVEKAEREQAAKSERKSAPSLSHKARRTTLTDLIEVLEQQKDWMSASKAAQELGIGDGSSSDDVEAFYRQLKDYFEGGAVEVERRGDEDWLRLAKAEAS